MRLSLVVPGLPTGGQRLDHVGIFAQALEGSIRRGAKGGTTIGRSLAQRQNPTSHGRPLTVRSGTTQKALDVFRGFGYRRYVFRHDEGPEGRLVGGDIKRLKQLHVRRRLTSDDRRPRGSQATAPVRPLQRVNELSSSIESIGRLLGHRFLYHLFQRLGQPRSPFSQSGVLGRDVLRENCLRCATRERGTSGQHLVHDYTHAVHVGSSVEIPLAGCLLG